MRFISFLCLCLIVPSISVAKEKKASSSDADGWTVLFRADDPLIWNKDAGKSSDDNGFARKLDKAPEFKFLRLRRMDTGDAVIVKMEQSQLEKSTTLNDRLIWSVTPVRGPKDNPNRLLGIAYEPWAAKNKHLVARIPGQTDHGYRGWGFSKGQSSDPTQTYSWAGEGIDKTVFEISVKNDPLTKEEQSQLLSSATIAKLSPANEPEPTDDSVPTTKLARLQASIKALYIREESSGEMLGTAWDLIATATPGKPKGETPVTFATPVGNQMHIVLGDVLRAVRVKYPRWNATRIELSFENKYTPKDGGSIGAAIGTLLLAMIEDFEIDPAVAITGDVTSDSKVRPIGGVAAKIRAATAANCKIVAMPVGNIDQMNDALVWDGPSLFTNVQVLGIANLDQAKAVIRADRDAKLKQAIGQFVELQETLKKSPETLRSKASQERLGSIVELAPNHLSAKLLLDFAQNKQAKKLSATASMYHLFVAVGTMAPTVFEKRFTAKNQVANSVIEDGLKSLAKVRRLAAPEIYPLVDAWSEFMRTLSDVQSGRASPKALEAKGQNLLDAMNKQQANRDLMEKMLHEGV